MYLTNVWTDVAFINNSTIRGAITTYDRLYMILYDYNYNRIKDFKHNNWYSEQLLKQSVLGKYLFESRIEHNHKDTIGGVYLYRVPRSLVIAYNETCLFDGIKTGISYIYRMLECKDIFVIIVSHLFELVRRDFSRYICANKT